MNHTHDWTLKLLEDVMYTYDFQGVYSHELYAYNAIKNDGYIALTKGIA